MIFGKFDEGGIKSTVFVPMALHEVILPGYRKVINKYPDELA